MWELLLVDGETVGDEGESETRSFSRSCALNIEVQIDACVRRAARMLPGVHVAARAMEHDAEFDVCPAHGILLTQRARASPCQAIQRRQAGRQRLERDCR